MKRTIKWWRGPAHIGRRYAWLPKRVGHELFWLEWYPDYTTSRAILLLLLEMSDEEFGRIPYPIFRELMTAHDNDAPPKWGKHHKAAKRLIRDRLRTRRR